MKYLAILVLLLGFTAPVQAGEVDGRALECVTKETQIYPRYFIFENGTAYTPFVTDHLPLTIKKLGYGKYLSTVEYIEWNSTPDNVGYRLNRKTLQLYDYNTSNYVVHDCRIVGRQEVFAALNKEIEKLKEKMKDNKI